MPSFAIGSSPIQISQFLTQQGLITNDGDVPVYLDVDSSVSPTQYGMRLLPRQSVNWSSGTLWGVVELGSGLIAVQYGANTSVSPVTSIDGPIDAVIQGPVDVTVLGTVDANITGPVDAVVTGSVDATLTGPVDATITGPVTATVSGAVAVTSIGSVVSTNVTNTVDTTVTNQVQTEVTNTVTAEIANIVTVEGDVNAVVTGAVDATITGPVTVSGTVDADITGPVTANISGPVTVAGINAPVNVQGGGDVLAVQTFTTQTFASGVQTVTVSAPPNGLTYYGLRVIVQVLSGPGGAGDANLAIRALGSVGYEGGLYVTDSATQLGGLQGKVHMFVLPMDVDYPYQVLTRVFGPGTLTYRVTVQGISAAPARVTTDLAFPLLGQVTGPATSVALSATTSYVYLPPSYTPYRVRIVTNSSSTITGGIYQEAFNRVTDVINTVTPSNIIDRIQVPEYYPLTTANTLPALTTVSFVVPGSGNGGRLALLGTGTCSVSIAQLN